MISNSTKASAVVVAGGQGTRAGTTRPKQYQMMGGRPILRWSVEAFARDGRFAQIVVVRAPENAADANAALDGLTVTFAAAGLSRTQSVRAGLAALEPDTDLVFIHDAARPGLSKDVLDRLFAALADDDLDGVAPALPVSDALWHTTSDSRLIEAKDRTGLMRVQTPQVFRVTSILRAYERVSAEAELADDLAVGLEAGLKLAWCKGGIELDKITWNEDFARMERQLTPLLLPRIGAGFDAHRFVDGSFVTLCGIEVAHHQRLAGHSDADVAWHALADAIYGALGQGDIGAHFPPSDPQWKGAASEVFLAHAAQSVLQAGGRISNVDLTIICEAPRIGPHREAMRARTAQVLGVRLDQVSVKATTTEEMGFTGRREGIAAQATALVLLPEGAPSS